MLKVKKDIYSKIKLSKPKASTAHLSRRIAPYMSPYTSSKEVWAKISHARSVGK